MKYYNENKQPVLKKQHKYQKRTRSKLIDIIGDKKCIICGFSDIRALQIDHIGGGGYGDKIMKGGVQQMYTYYYQHPQEAKEKLQILCANCNWIKRHEEKEFSNNIQ